MKDSTFKIDPTTTSKIDPFNLGGTNAPHSVNDLLDSRGGIKSYDDVSQTIKITLEQYKQAVSFMRIIRGELKIHQIE